MNIQQLSDSEAPSRYNDLLRSAQADTAESRYTEAKKKLLCIINEQRHIEDFEFLIQVYRQYGRLCLREGEFDDMRCSIQQAADEAHRRNDRDFIAACHGFWGAYYFYVTEPAKAIEAYQHGIDLLQPQGDSVTLGLIYSETARDELTGASAPATEQTARLTRDDVSIVVTAQAAYQTDGENLAYEFRAWDIYGNELASAPTASVSTGSTALPAAPQNVCVVASGNDVILSWEAVTTNANGAQVVVSQYNVYCGASSDFAPDSATYRTSTTETTVTLTGLSLEYERVYLKVTAVSGQLTRE